MDLIPERSTRGATGGRWFKSTRRDPFMIHANLKAQLEPESRKIANTIDWLAANYRTSPVALDSSPIIITAFKLLELEVRAKVFEAYGSEISRSVRDRVPPFEDQHGRSITALSDFLRSGRPLTLGDMMLVLAWLASVPSACDGNAYS